jgi:alpha 1,2-mannosyltransferase
MCRFNSGFFFEQEVLEKYKWYWRVEPGVEVSSPFHTNGPFASALTSSGRQYFCDIDYDPFLFVSGGYEVSSARVRLLTP